MRPVYAIGLSATLMVWMAAFAQQPASPAPASATVPTPPVAAAPHDCSKTMGDKMSAGDKAAMPMSAGCGKAETAAEAKRKAKAKRHDHAQFHK